ncbi:MAG: dddD [Phenylobacterium sp.]|nr:dddD [Phenylobacterium sp.]
MDGLIDCISILITKACRNPEILSFSGVDVESYRGCRSLFASQSTTASGASFEVAGQYNEPMPPSPNEDVGNGLSGAIAMVLALLVRRTTGQALACESPQLNAAMSLLAHIVRAPDGQVIGGERLDVTQSGTSALESLYPTADGWLCLAARTDAEIARLETLLGLGLLAEERFATIQAREANREALADLLRAGFARRQSADWLARAAGSGLGLVEPVDGGFSHRFLNDPEQRRNGRVAEVCHPEKGNVREIDRLVRISDLELAPHRLAPGLGEHTDEILALWGHDAEGIAALRAAGAVR